MIKWFIFFLLLTLSFSCHQEKVIIEKKATIDENIGWVFEDSLRVGFTISDTSRFYAMRLQLKYHPDFNFENVYTRIQTFFPDGKQISQLLSLQLTNERGAWAGKCSRYVCAVEIPLQEYLLFPAIGNYKLSIAQYTRMDTLKDFKNLTFLLVDMGDRKRLTKSSIIY
jgi:gliding motility-associated lipoprotein GldH